MISCDDLVWLGAVVNSIEVIVNSGQYGESEVKAWLSSRVQIFTTHESGCSHSNTLLETTEFKATL